ncbi:LOW QUALITY PROTEIN: regulator of G-protein signaling 22 [Arvicola amphibius]|uniref:LOW QUALITY PROTEIN: regulator of G-protein signaling 22 n=1 Tax=Arvicola amphibius TaxID=1047088 RepID=UPI0018E2D765|nr:LOW QUALITY PROTEIN: regulator of G-protein signaling 22 [Arvicola amphibius]
MAKEDGVPSLEPAGLVCMAQVSLHSCDSKGQPLTARKQRPGAEVQTFSEAIRFNVDYGVFEVINDAPQLLEKQLKRILRNQQPRNPIYDVIRKGKSDAKPFQKSVPCEDETINVNYTIMCLNREQGIKWIKRKRLPAFLESDCYFEYRLAKLISQATWSNTGINFIVGTSFSPWVLRKPPTPPPPTDEEDNLMIMKKFYISLGQASYTQTKDWFTLAKQCQQTVTTFSLPCCVSHPKTASPTLSSVSENLIFDDGVHPRTKKSPTKTSEMIPEVEEEEEGSVSVKDTPSQALLRIYLERKDKEDNQKTVHFSSFEEFLNAYIVFILKEAIQHITGHSFSSSLSYIDFSSVTQVTFDKVEPVPSKKTVSPPQLETTKEISEEKLEKVSLSSKSESIGPDGRADWCISHRTYDIGNRREFERFKKFLKGTLGERYWWLWMDIERLKVLKDPGRHQRHLEKMKKSYLVSSGERFLSTEILSKFKLLNGSRWTEEHLKNIQIEVIKPLLLYWAPRFCVTHSLSTKNASAELKFWRLRQEKPRKDVDPFPQMATLLPLRPKSCIPQVPEVQGEEISLLQRSKSPKKLSRVSTGSQKPGRSESLHPVPSKDDRLEKESKWLPEGGTVIRLTSFTDISECLKPQLDRKYTYTEELSVKTTSDVGALGGSDMESLLQSLYVENRAGFFFTKFCEDSGNKLWKHSVYFWFDLQAYHQLFYQDTLQPFKVCKQAQYLFATYIAPSATLDIGLQQEEKKDIYMRIQPPFEDLFDTAEEYILLILLEPWTQMVMSDQVAYRKVTLQEETRQLDSTYFRKLQALHKETVSKEAEDAAGPAAGKLSLSDVSKQTEYWSNVPEEYRHFTFSDLLSNKLEFEHFRQFLESHSSSIDLACWTDIEQFRRMLFKDQKQREAKSIDIKNKYLNKKYFFGPSSPASLHQQDQIMLMSGGWGRILHEQLDPSVLVEIQKHVLNRLENVWLPLFLSSEQFASRQKIKIRMKDIADELLLQRHARKIGVWKPVASKWISSSCEIIAFRKALLNPVIARQFQRFVALKGDLLENGVLFWQEVQKFKDLCHSHCTESIIQKKITTIINCFINSCIPPALQIDIPVEQAQKIIEHRKELGPYVFREAQMTIFGVLFKFWPQFCEFRKNLTDEKIMSVLERRQEHKQKKKMSESDEDKIGKAGVKQYTSTTGSLTKAPLASESLLGLQAYGRQPTWCYSKYIEALEQERILLKIQEEMEKKMFTGTSSFSNLVKLPTGSTMSLKKNLSLLSSCSLSAFLTIQNQRHCLSPENAQSLCL